MVRRRVPVRTIPGTFAVPPGDITAAQWSGLTSRVDPGTAGGAGQLLGWTPLGVPVVLDTTYNVKAFGAVGDSSTNDTAAIQAAIDAAEAAGGGTVFFPAGTYTYTGLTVSADWITFRGVGRKASYLRNVTGTGITLNHAYGFGLEHLRMVNTAGHCLVVTDSLSHSRVYDAALECWSTAHSVLQADDGGAGTLNYIDNTWLHFETRHSESATVPSINLRGGAVNRNRWMSGRHTYTGNYAFLIETTATSSYANDNVISDINFEVCTGGVVKALGAQKLQLINLAVYDLSSSTTRDLIYLGNSTVTTTLGSRNIKIDGYNRNGFTLGSGKYDINLAVTSATPHLMLQSSGNVTSIAVNFNGKRATVQESVITPTSDASVTYLDSASTGSTFAETVTFKKQIKLASYTTAGRPAAATAGAGAVIWNTSTSKPNYSDGTNWRDAAGTVV